MTRLVFESWALLLYVEFVMLLRNLEALHNIVRNGAVHSDSGCLTTEDVCHAMDLGCVFYFKQVMCLQRSAATALLLRRHGWKAEMVIGAQILPPKFHAWVEINGAVVNDKPYMPDIYKVLERC